MDGRLLEACATHDPQAAAHALFEHLELASLFFERELGGQGIFARGS
jgi:DNA-binding GntR family transcriptional regulator